MGWFIWGHDPNGWRIEGINKEGEKANPVVNELVKTVDNGNSVLLRT